MPLAVSTRRNCSGLPLICSSVQVPLETKTWMELARLEQ
jgi:hypothetical protein